MVEQTQDDQSKINTTKDTESDQLLNIEEESK